MERPDPTPSTFPIYGALVGPIEGADIQICHGVRISKTFVDGFSSPMMAFGPPVPPAKHHPGPWVPMRGGVGFRCRSEVEILEASALRTLEPHFAMWMVAATLRLHGRGASYVAVLSPRSFASLRQAEDAFVASEFEREPNKFYPPSVGLDPDAGTWLVDRLPSATALLADDRFRRAFQIYDQSHWAPTFDMAIQLVWTSLEVFFGLSSVQGKAKAISRAVANHVGEGPADVDRAYGVVRDMYEQRGRSVHAGRQVSIEVARQTHQLARVAFRRALIEGRLPQR